MNQLPNVEKTASLNPTSRVRYRVLAFAVMLAGITYLDRVCISLTAPAMMRDLGLSKVQMSLVFSAFTLAYGLFEIPTGWWGDRIGTRRVLTRIVIWWSSFTMFTAGAFSYASLLVIRFLFGIGEAGAWPNAAKTFSRWFPVTERGTAQGIFFMGAHLAGGLTPLLVTAMLTRMTGAASSWFLVRSDSCGRRRGTGGSAMNRSNTHLFHPPSWRIFSRGAARLPRISSAQRLGKIF